MLVIGVKNLTERRDLGISAKSNMMAFDGL